MHGDTIAFDKPRNAIPYCGDDAGELMPKGMGRFEEGYPRM